MADLGISTAFRNFQRPRGNIHFSDLYTDCLYRGFAMHCCSWNHARQFLCRCVSLCVYVCVCVREYWSACFAGYRPYLSRAYLSFLKFAPSNDWLSVFENWMDFIRQLSLYNYTKRVKVQLVSFSQNDPRRKYYVHRNLHDDQSKRERKNSYF